MVNYHLFKEVLELFKDEVRKEDQLYIPVLSKLFGCDITIMQGEHASKGLRDYYCVPTAKWKEKNW